MHLLQPVSVLHQFLLRFQFRSSAVSAQPGSPLALSEQMLRNFHAFQIAKQIHFACQKLQISRLLRDQLLRASSSIALNTAEGSGKRTLPDQRRFYGIALGSLRECEAILELEQIEDKSLLSLMDQLGAILYTLTREPNSSTPRTDNRFRTATATATGAP